MEQVYWLSRPVDPSLSDTRNLIYRYGNFVYSGLVITEPVKGLEYLPGVLQGIQAVQGQVPYLCEYKELADDSEPRKSLRALEVAMDTIHEQVTAFEPRMTIAATAGNSWLEDDDAAVYFEFQARPGHNCHNSDVVFAKSYRGGVLMTVIWYGPGSCYYVTLSPATGEEQALVDTLFPSIYGKRRGLALAEYSIPQAGGASSAGVYNGEEDYATASGKGRAGGGGEGKEEDDGCALPPHRLFTSASVWEASEPVPDPDVVREREEMEDALNEMIERAKAVMIAVEEADAAAGNVSGGSDEEGDSDEEEERTVDVSGGSGYTQVYMILKPPETVLTSPTASASSGSGASTGTTPLIPREALFRFGDWIYAGVVEFPVDSLRLGDVPHVLPALQKQQGRLEYLSEATKMPARHFMAPILTSFMASLSLLKQQMEDSQEDLAALAEQGLNAWIDADWSASFFELALAGAMPGGIPPPMEEVELIACKVYLSLGTGLVLHVVYFEGSLYCVLADAVEDLPLLDVAFPDVTARNRVVQVRTYDVGLAKKLQAAHGGEGVAPIPRALRVWEGRRKGVVGVGYGAANALSDGDAAAIEELRERARRRAEADAAAQAAAAAAAGSKRAGAAKAAASSAAESKVSDSAASPSTSSSTATPRESASTASTGASSARASGALGADGKVGDADDNEDDIYDMGGAKATLTATAAKTTSASAAAGSKPSASTAAAASAPAPSASASASASDSKGGEDDFDPDAVIAGLKGASASGGYGKGRGPHMPSALLHSVARGPHHLAPLQRPAASSGSAVGGSGVGGSATSSSSLSVGEGDASVNRLVLPSSAGGGIAPGALGGAVAAVAGAGGGASASDSKWEEAPWDASGRPKATGTAGKAR